MLRRCAGPKAKAAHEGIFILSQGNTPGQLSQLRGVPTTDHDDVGFHCGTQQLNHDENLLAPFSRPEALEPARSDAVLIGSP